MAVVTATVFPTEAALGEALAAVIVEGIEAASRAGRPYVLGCPGGRSPKSTYAALARLVRARGTDLSGLVVAMMDDYVEVAADGGYDHVSDHLPHSCRRFGRQEIVEPLSAAAGPGRGLAEDALWMPDPRRPDDYDRRIAAAGGIDLFLLASGASDGHVAFNPPGTARDSVTRVVELAHSTRQDNLVTFPMLDGLDAVPRHGVTVGIETIAGHSMSAVLIAVGRDKARAVQRIAAAESYDPDWPATVLAECREPLLFTDAAAMAVPGPLDLARST